MMNLVKEEREGRKKPASQWGRQYPVVASQALRPKSFRTKSDSYNMAALEPQHNRSCLHTCYTFDLLLGDGQQYFFMFLVLGCFFGHTACGDVNSLPGIKTRSPALEGEVSTTGLPGKSP